MRFDDFRHELIQLVQRPGRFRRLGRIENRGAGLGQDACFVPGLRQQIGDKIADDSPPSSAGNADNLDFFAGGIVQRLTDFRVGCVRVVDAADGDVRQTVARIGKGELIADDYRRSSLFSSQFHPGRVDGRVFHGHVNLAGFYA